jgi:hypothetical protein
MEQATCPTIVFNQNLTQSLEVEEENTSFQPMIYARSSTFRPELWQRFTCQLWTQNHLKYKLELLKVNVLLSSGLTSGFDRRGCHMSTTSLPCHVNRSHLLNHLRLKCETFQQSELAIRMVRVRGWKVNFAKSLVLKKWTLQCKKKSKQNTVWSWTTCQLGLI